MYKCPGRHIRRSQDRESRKDSKTNTVHYEQQSAVLDHKLEVCGTYGLAFRHCLEVIEDVRKNERFAKRKRATTRDTAKEGGGRDAKAFLSFSCAQQQARLQAEVHAQDTTRGHAALMTSWTPC
jgi:hypothetical protein